MAADTPPTANVRHRPRATTVFVAAFVAGAAAAVGVNRVLDVHLAQAKPQVECEPIFVALRSLPQGVPVTVWDVALRDWPKAMLPISALRVTDSFEGCLLKYPLREGQPLLAAQLLQPEVVAPVVEPKPTHDEAEQEIVEEAFVAPVPATAPVAVTPLTGPTAPLTTATESPPTPESAARSDAASAVAEPAAVAGTEPTAGDSLAPAAAGAIAAAAETDSLSVQPAPEPHPVAESREAPAASREPSSPVVSGQPTLADPSASPSTSWAAVGPQPPRGGGDAPADAETAFDLPAQPAVDLSSLPSVMAREDAGSLPDDQAAAAGDVRYLVVPERIARQADTSFTTPVAPEMQPSVEPALAEAGQAAPEQPSQRQPQAPQAQQRQAQRRQAQQRQPQALQPQQRQPQQRQAQQRQAQSRPTQPGQRPKQGQQPQPSEPDGQKTDPRAWGEMFPNVSAGLEAIGSWRSRVREAVAPQRPEAGQPAPQRR